MTADLGSLWTSVIFAAVLGIVTLAFSIYQAQRGIVPGQRDALNDMRAKLNEQEVIIHSLQRQSAEQWTRSIDQERKINELSVENGMLKKLTQEQAIIIQALQRSLGGLAQGNQRTGKRLREVLTKRLNETELKLWAADLDIPFDNLSGDSLPGLVLSMLDTLERYGRLEEGLAALRQRRPDIPLDGIL